jgi:hypothetical protein
MDANFGCGGRAVSQRSMTKLLVRPGVRHQPGAKRWGGSVHPLEPLSMISRRK